MGTVTPGCPDGYGITIMRQPGLMTGLGINPPALGALTEIVSVQWRRVRSDIASAQIVVKGCGPNDQVLARDGIIADPWAYEIVIHRDSKIAFMGPILDVVWHKDTAVWEINAGDILTWINVREIFPSYTSPTTDAATIFVDLLDTYFDDNGDDPDLFRHVLQVGTAAVPIDLFYNTSEFSISDKMRELVNMGANFTTVGRTILVFGEDPPNYDKPMFMSANDISGSMRLFKSGRSPFGVHTIGHGRIVGFGVGPTAADELWFGKVSRHTNFGDITDQPQCEDLTIAWNKTTRVMRNDLDISSGAQIGQDAIFYGDTNLMDSVYALDFLVPGYRYDVSITKPEFPISGAFPMRLDEVIVDWTPEAGEQIKVTFVTLGSEQGAE